MTQPDVSIDLLHRYNVQGPRYTSYPTAPVWREELGAQDYANILAGEPGAQSRPPLSLYLHLPFCEALCYFCACTVVITGRNHTPEAGYLASVEREMDWVAQRISAGRTVTQLHWGGGTPTYFSPERLLRLGTRMREAFHFAPDAELGVEVDPRVTTPEHLDILARLGFNRLSLGVQDFDPAVQRAINRIQPFEQTRGLVQAARALGFPSVNVDLIYGLPLQTPESFSRTIDAVLEIGPDRLAVYSYANVPWLKKHQNVFADRLPDERAKFEIFRTALARFTDAGFEYIGMDHFARPEDELAVARRERTLHRNFQGYTTKAGTDLIGLGVSAIGSIGSHYVQNARELSAYQAAIAHRGAATFRGFRLSEDDRLRRAVIQNLLCHGTVVKREIEETFRIAFDRYFAAALEGLAPCAEDGLVELTREEVRATPLGRIFLRNLAMPFDAYLPASAGSEKPVFSRTL